MIARLDEIARLTKENDGLRAKVERLRLALMLMTGAMSPRDIAADALKETT